MAALPQPRAATLGRPYKMRYRFLTADVFTDRIFGGNPLAVFPDGRGLSTEQMQRVAGAVLVSEGMIEIPG